ncbi:hypothetical protein GCM10027059_44590 [Myceligenerans halotolerans]
MCCSFPLHYKSADGSSGLAGQRLDGFPNSASRVLAQDGSRGHAQDQPSSDLAFGAAERRQPADSIDVGNRGEELGPKWRLSQILQRRAERRAGRRDGGWCHCVATSIIELKRRANFWDSTAYFSYMRTREAYFEYSKGAEYRAGLRAIAT